MIELDTLSAALRGLASPALAVAVALRASVSVQSALAASAGAGNTPDGARWASTKKGKRAYQHAAASISTVADGPYVIVTLKGPEVFGQLGVHGIAQRQMIPESGSMPKAIVDALDKAVAQVIGARL